MVDVESSETRSLPKTDALSNCATGAWLGFNLRGGAGGYKLVGLGCAGGDVVTRQAGLKDRVLGNAERRAEFLRIELRERRAEFLWIQHRNGRLNSGAFGCGTHAG